MNNLMILWRSWFLPWRTETPDEDTHVNRLCHQSPPAGRAEIIAILAEKSERKETTC
jgi:hypothetical protein